MIGPDNQLLSDGTYNYTYDADGNEATKTNIATGDKWVYNYNNADQLVSAVKTSANGTVETQVIIKYDVFGNRIEEDIWTPSTGWTTTRYAYDAWDPATPSGVGNENWKVWATLDGNNNLVTRYINGDALDQVFAQISASGGVAWYLTDRLGSTRTLVDNNGNVLDAINYDAWGNIISQTNPSAQPLFMFTGIAYDARLGLYFNGNGGREYDPKSGRFIEQDPMQYRAGDSNLYRYVGNDSTNAIDPSGLQDLGEGAYRAGMALSGLADKEKKILESIYKHDKETVIRDFKAVAAKNKVDPKIVQQILDATVGTSRPWTINPCKQWAESVFGKMPPMKPSGEVIGAKKVYVSIVAWTFEPCCENLWCLFADGHFAIQVKLPDGSVFYFDDGDWGCVFTERDIPRYAK